MIPSLLLRPEGSYSWTPEDGVQEVTPTGVGVEVVEGQYGQAWHALVPNAYVRADIVGRIAEDHDFTILVRAKRGADVVGNSYPITINGTGGIALGSSGSSGNYLCYVGGYSTIAAPLSVPLDEYVTYGVRYTGGMKTPFINGATTGAISNPPPDFGTWTYLYLQPGISAPVESLLIFPEALSDTDIQRISTMDEAWTMQNVSTPEMRVKQSGVGSPSLLLRPEGSYTWTPEDGVQAVTPTVGGNVELVDLNGRPAWKCIGPEGAINRVSVPYSEDILSTDGDWTILTRFVLVSGMYNFIINENGTNGALMGGACYIGGGKVGDMNIVLGTTHVTALSRLGSEAHLYIDGNLVKSHSGVLTPTFDGPICIIANAAIGETITESALIFPEALSDADIHRISTMTEAWTMENVKRPGEVVRVAGMYTKRQGLLKETRLG